MNNEYNKFEDLITKPFKKVDKQLKESLNLSDVRDAELENLLKPRRKLEKANTFRYPLITSFGKKNEWNIPTPFWNLFQKLEKLQVHLAQEWEIYNIIFFWRFYACYRYGLEWNVITDFLTEQLRYERKEDKEILINFWNTELKVLRKKLRKYVAINKYFIMPLNRFFYRWSNKGE